MARKVQLTVPAGLIEGAQRLHARLLRIDQRGHQNPAAVAELADRQRFRQLLIECFLQPIRALRLRPDDQVVTAAQASPLPEIAPPPLVLRAQHIDAPLLKQSDHQ